MAIVDRSQLAADGSVMVDFSSIIECFRKKWKKLILVPVLFVLVATGASALLTKDSWTSSGALFLNPQTNLRGNVDPNSFTANQKVIADLIAIAQQPDELASIADKAGVSAEEIEDRLQMVRIPNTELISVSISDSSREKADQIVQATMDELVERLRSSLRSENVEVISSPFSVKDSKASKIIRNTLIAFMIGIIVSFFWILKMVRPHKGKKQEIEQKL